MKMVTRVLTILVISIVALSLSLTAFAEDVGGFLQSPSANDAPTVEDSHSEEHECDEPLTIVSYADRDKLPEEDKEKIEKAYSKIKGVNNLTTACSALKALAEEKKIPTGNLAVSDLFDISDKHDDAHDATFKVSLKAETLDNFVALLHFVDGKWEIVEDAKVKTVDGESYVEFTTEGLSPFAIVVDTGEEVPVKSNNTLVIILAVVSIAEAAALISIFIKFLLSKKFA